jgi:arylsulfatase A-like enzyme
VKKTIAFFLSGKFISPLRFAILLMAALVFLSPRFSSDLRADETSRPNVILIMTDDMGYGDLGVTGNPVIRVPNLDRLARESVEVETFYVSPVCAPTRASLMTGRYHYRTGVTDTWLGRAMMHADETTVAELLKEAGYRTGIFGKWHLGDCYPMRPQDQGFQEVLVHTGGGLCQPAGPPDNSYFDPSLLHNGERIQTQGYCSDVYVDYLLRFIEEAPEKPFFIYLPFNCPHGPYQISEEYKEPYDEMNLKPSDFPQIGTPKTVPKNTTAVYGMVENIDDNIGRIMKKLEDLDLRENTIVIFLTDNGPNGSRYNAGFRQHKGSVYEGGIRTVFFVRWPKRLEAGHQVKQMGAHIDVLPTICQACEVPVPEDLNLDGRSLLPLLEGKEVRWRDRYYVAQWHRGDVPVPYRKFSIRDGRYKLVQPSDRVPNVELEPYPEFSDPSGIPFELYDLVSDPYEEHNIAGEHPEVVERLRKAYDTWLVDVSQDHGYEAPKIHIGTPHENPTILTRQDWRGKDANWSNFGIGHWELAVARGGKYEILVEHDAPKEAAEAVVKIQGQTFTVNLSPNRKSFTVVTEPLTESEAERLETWIDRESGKSYGARYVHVKRL